jgi:hypothetical protein
MKAKDQSSYQRMKQRYEAKIRELTDDIYTLIDDKNYMNCLIVKNNYIFRREAIKAMMFGKIEIKNKLIIEDRERPVNFCIKTNCNNPNPYYRSNNDGFFSDEDICKKTK